MRPSRPDMNPPRKWSSPWERRDFLRALSGGALIPLGTALPGCGGGSDGGGDGGGGSGGGSGVLSAEQVAAAIASVDARIASLTPASVDELRASVLQFLEGSGDFISAGVTDDCVWGTLANGGTYFVLTNRTPQPGEETLTAAMQTARPAQRALGADVPKGSLKALLVNAMGTAFANEASAIRPAPAAVGYTATTDPGALDSLKSLGSPAFFYLSAHGSVCPIPQLDANGKMVRGNDGKVVMVNDYCVSTSTVATKEAIQARMADFEAGLIVAGRMVEDLVGVVYVSKTMFAVTSRWVTRYWQFATDSLVWMSACSGMSAGAAPFRAACQAKGAGLFVGWTDPVSGPAALGGAAFVVDRLLGANVLNPKESPGQRPFDYTSIWPDLQARGLDRSQVTDSVTGAAIPGRIARLTYSAKAGTKFGILAPSISHVLVDEPHDKVHLYGIFGTPPADERIALIDGLEATVDSWTENEIVCVLPRNGQGSKGEVKVSVRGHDSNVRHITEWNFDVTHTYDDKDRPGLRIDGHYLLRFRGDIGEYRTKPHETPQKPLRCLIASLDSVASFTAKGTHSSGGTTYQWSGSADFPAALFQQTPQERIVAAVLKVDTETKTGALGLALGAFAPSVFTEVQTDSSGSVTMQFPPFQSILEEEAEFPIEYPDGMVIGLALPAMVFGLSDNFGIPAHKFIDVELNELTMEWPAVAASGPPDNRIARSRG